MALEKMFMGSIQAQYKSLTHDNAPPWYETLEVNSTQLCFKLDSSADVSIISKTEYDRMKVKPPLMQTRINLTGVAANIDLSGYFNAQIKRANQRSMCDSNLRRKSQN